MDRRMIKRGQQDATQLLIHQQGLSPAEATWEFVDEVKLRFPTLHLEDKEVIKEGELLQARYIWEVQQGENEFKEKLPLQRYAPFYLLELYFT